MPQNPSVDAPVRAKSDSPHPSQETYSKILERFNLLFQWQNQVHDRRRLQVWETLLKTNQKSLSKFKDRDCWDLDEETYSIYRACLRHLEMKSEDLDQVAATLKTRVERSEEDPAAFLARDRHGLRSSRDIQGSLARFKPIPAKPNKNLQELSARKTLHEEGYSRHRRNKMLAKLEGTNSVLSRTMRKAQFFQEIREGVEQAISLKGLKLGRG